MSFHELFNNSSVKIFKNDNFGLLFILWQPLHTKTN